MATSCLFQRELHDVGVAGGKRRFAIRQVELPDAHEAAVEAQLAHGGFLRQEAHAPAAQRLGIVGAETQLVDDAQPGAFGLLAKGRRAGQQPAGEDVLLDEIGGIDVAFEQVVADGDALDAGASARLEQRVQLGEEAGPVLAADGFEHLDRSHRVVGAVGQVAVILQPQIGLVGQPGIVQPPLARRPTARWTA